MRHALDQIRRVIVLCAIVIFSGAMYCTTIDGGIQFAPGYGYVVAVTEPGDTEDDRFYFVFDTEEEARKWAFNFQQTPSKKVALNAPGYRLKVDDEADKELFTQITEALKLHNEPPVGTITQPIDQVVPPIPTAPAPR